MALLFQLPASAQQMEAEFDRMSSRSSSTWIGFCLCPDLACSRTASPNHCCSDWSMALERNCDFLGPSSSACFRGSGTPSRHLSNHPESVRSIEKARQCLTMVAVAAVGCHRRDHPLSLFGTVSSPAPAPAVPHYFLWHTVQSAAPRVLV